MAAAGSGDITARKQAATMTDTDKRFAALEERIAHQDHIIEDLSDMSVKQWKEISELSDKLGYLKSKLDGIEDGPEGSPGKEPPPPHY
jgi:SlyX protein